ncbi:hypothetical protein [Nocardia cyriacigeorgica]|uniref:hypothetical protein n=1 Tax=Nocardia cyriacigeorgica TaxID=135487 RepID=UPI002454557C|nr:hypothetical protein [Nocardia cyriacigeorgica]
MFGFGRRSNQPIELSTVDRVVRELELPDAVYKSCPWQPSDLVETGLRQWLRCCGAAMRDGQVIGMPSHAVDEAWHGFILCTQMYAEFCTAAYGRFLHHFPEGVATRTASHGSMADQLGRTVVAWSIVAAPDERCVLWDLDTRVGVDQPWGISAERVAAIEAELRRAGASEAG